MATGGKACKSGDSTVGKIRFPRYAAAMELAEVTCPTCFEAFEVAMPHPDEMPAEVDYDCEVCCRPMLIVFTENEVYAKGLGD
jgi:hypothetical protein